MVPSSQNATTAIITMKFQIPDNNKDKDIINSPQITEKIPPNR